MKTFLSLCLLFFGLSLSAQFTHAVLHVEIDDWHPDVNEFTEQKLLESMGAFVEFEPLSVDAVNQDCSNCALVLSGDWSNDYNWSKNLRVKKSDFDDPIYPLLLVSNSSNQGSTSFENADWVLNSLHSFTTSLEGNWLLIIELLDTGKIYWAHPCLSEDYLNTGVSQCDVLCDFYNDSAVFADCPFDTPVEGYQGESCPTDVNGDEVVNMLDLLQLLSDFGLACPTE